MVRLLADLFFTCPKKAETDRKKKAIWDRIKLWRGEGDIWPFLNQ